MFNISFIMLLLVLLCSKEPYCNTTADIGNGDGVIPYDGSNDGYIEITPEGHYTLYGHTALKIYVSDVIVHE